MEKKTSMKKRKSTKAAEPVPEVQKVGPYRNIEEAKKH